MEGEEGWKSHAEAIAVAELGQEEYDKRMNVQKRLFKKATENGNIFDNISIGWKGSKLKAMFELATLRSGKRGTHSVGVGAQGFARVVDDQSLPDNDFFKAGRLFEVRIRHSNFPDAEDDTKPNIRSLAIKFADHDVESPLDLICHTGPWSPFFNADSIFDLVSGLRGGIESAKKYLLSLPIYLDAHIKGIRRMPDSYYHQHFYAQTVYDFKCTDGKKRLARFRIKPADGSSESGMMTEEEQKVSWNMEAPPDSGKEKDYLKKEFSQRISKGHVEYVLQIQTYEAQSDSVIDKAMYNAASDWPGSDLPWKDLMKITLTSELPKDVIEVTRFNIGNHPNEVLSFPEPMTHHDFNVIPYLRSTVYASASSIRPKEPKEFEGDTVEYEIKVVTGKKKKVPTATLR